MRRFNILFAFAFILLTSCFTDEVDYVGYQPSSNGGIHIIGAVEDYDVKSVGTRADDNDIADSYISEMTMFIFKGDGTLIQGYSDASLDNACTSAINIQRGNPTFLIDTKEGILADLSGSTNSSEVFYDNMADDLTSCDIYIVANAWHQLSAPIEEGSTTRFVDNIKTLADLEAFVYNVDSTLAMPMIDNDSFRGFPMIGKQQGKPFNLHEKGDNSNNSVATIPLKKLYSKVCFTMQINADQVVAGQTPSFKIDHVEVFNVPKKVRMGRKLDANGKPIYGTNSDDDYLMEMGAPTITKPDEYYHFCSDTTAYVINSFNKRTISHSTSLTTDDVIEFSFYMPEHKVTPNPIQLPSTMTPEEKEKYAQYYKPTGVGAVPNGDGTTSAAKIATFVRIHGSYTDHNGQILGVKYDIYLGQNNYNDFTVKRNQQLNNKLIITGLTNHKNAYPNDEGNISIDHRVEVSDRGFNLSMERTAILDAHFEVRPLDIELQPGATMTITIPEEGDYRQWIAMEDDAVAYDNKSGLYVNTTTARKGVRKYFTTNLVKELNAAPSPGTTGNGGTLFFENTKEEVQTFRIWFYVDENPNVYDKLWKEGDPKVSYTGAVNDVVTVGSGATAYTINKTTYRVCPVQFVYNGTKVVKDNATGESETVAVTNTETINFQQWNLWRVWSADRTRYYDIEHEEEYLNNYASDMQYGQTQDGMEYGLNGVQLSTSYRSLVVKQNISGWFSGIIEALKGFFGGDSMADIANTVFASGDNAIYYDFYLPRDLSSLMDGVSGSSEDISNKLTIREYSGSVFNSEISLMLKNKYASHQTENNNNPNVDVNLKFAQIEYIYLTTNPTSAFAYCYNKNKRNENGVVEAQKWFLPAIDEIEDIASGAYDEFNQVFQNKKYWSCQPSYDLRAMYLDIIRNKLTGGTSNEGSLTGNFFIDDIYRARATSVIVTLQGDNRVVSNILSSAPKKSGTQYGKAVFNWLGTSYVKNESGLTQFENVSPPISQTDYEKVPGNLPRTEKCRIRAVYRSGTK